MIETAKIYLFLVTGKIRFQFSMGAINFVGFAVQIGNEEKKNFSFD